MDSFLHIFARILETMFGVGMAGSAVVLLLTVIALARAAFQQPEEHADDNA